MLEALREEGLPAVGVSYGSNDETLAEMPMDWGTLIPLWFLGGRAEEPAPVVVVSSGARPFARRARARGRGHRQGVRRKPCGARRERGPRPCARPGRAVRLPSRSRRVRRADGRARLGEPSGRRAHARGDRRRGLGRQPVAGSRAARRAGSAASRPSSCPTSGPPTSACSAPRSSRAEASSDSAQRVVLDAGAGSDGRARAASATNGSDTTANAAPTQKVAAGPTSVQSTPPSTLATRSAPPTAAP